MQLCFNSKENNNLAKEYKSHLDDGSYKIFEDYIVAKTLDLSKNNWKKFMKSANTLVLFCNNQIPVTGVFLPKKKKNNCKSQIQSDLNSKFHFLCHKYYTGVPINKKTEWRLNESPSKNTDKIRTSSFFTYNMVAVLQNLPVTLLNYISKEPIVHRIIIAKHLKIK